MMPGERLPSPREFHIGLDDTDSGDGMCTTYLCYQLTKFLLGHAKADTILLDYPNLIRLNPNIPWKTRGNAALCLRIRTNIERKELFEICKSFVLKFATSERANAGLVILNAFEVPEAVKNFSKRALYSVLSIRETKQLIMDNEIDYFGLRSEQGLVGALSSVGNLLEGDHTFELIAYRQDASLPRAVNKQRVITMTKETYPGTFSSYDPVYDRVMISPHGPDPVLCGIRGESALDVFRAFSMLLPLENLGGYAIFRSNQGTAEHLEETICLNETKAFSSGRLAGEVVTLPNAGRGGHVFFKVRNSEGEIPCACYEPASEFRKIAMSLIPGDLIEVGGGVRKSTSSHPKILNLEYLRPVKLADRIRLRNPSCPNCGGSTASRGRNQGFICKKCKRIERDQVKSTVKEERKIKTQLYLPPVKAQRHLTKPMQRYLFPCEKKPGSSDLIENWID